MKFYFRGGTTQQSNFLFAQVFWPPPWALPPAFTGKGRGPNLVGDFTSGVADPTIKLFFFKFHQVSAGPLPVGRGAGPFLAQVILLPGWRRSARKPNFFS